MANGLVAGPGTVGGWGGFAQGLLGAVPGIIQAFQRPPRPRPLPADGWVPAGPWVPATGGMPPTFQQAGLGAGAGVVSRELARRAGGLIAGRGVGAVVAGGRAAWAAAKAAAAAAKGRLAKIPKRTLIEVGATAIGVGVWLLPSGETVQESRRRMNVLNPRALSRAQRRVCGFARFATRSYAIAGIVRRRRSGGACPTRRRRPCR